MTLTHGQAAAVTAVVVLPPILALADSAIKPFMNCDEILYPPFVSWEVITECNHKCQYCYNCNVEHFDSVKFDDNKVSQIIDFIIDHKPISVSVSGGEPLLVFDKIKKYIQKFCDNGIFVSVYTNGSVITDEMASFFAANNIRIMISFPSADEQEFSKIVNNKFTYKSVINAMNLMLEHKVNFQPNIVITSLNSNSVENTVDFLNSKYKVKKIFISRATRPSNADENYDNIRLSPEKLNKIYSNCVKLSQKYNIQMAACGGGAICAFDNPESRKMFSKVCSFGVDGYTITSTGDVRICSRDSKIYGNIFVDDFQKIRYNMRDWKEATIPQECKGCRYTEVCRGGCRLAKNSSCNAEKFIDCDANPKLFKKQKSSVKIPLFNPFRKFSAQKISVIEDKTMCRVSVRLKYTYVNKKTANLLTGKKQICYFDFLRAHRFKMSETNLGLKRLLILGIIK